MDEMTKTDFKKLYNLLVKINKNTDSKSESGIKPMLEKVLKNQKSMEDRLRRLENKLRKL